MTNETTADVCGYFDQLLIQPFACIIVIGIDVKVTSTERFKVLGFEECSRRNGNALVTTRQDTPAVATALSYEERFLWFEHLQHRSIIDVALAALGELEPRERVGWCKPTPLNTCQPPILIVVWNL